MLNFRKACTFCFFIFVFLFIVEPSFVFCKTDFLPLEIVFKNYELPPLYDLSPPKPPKPFKIPSIEGFSEVKVVPQEKKVFMG